MKKLLCSIILTMLIIFGAVNCLAAEEETYYIYKAVNFEDHNVGDLPRMFTYHLFSGTHDNDHAGYLTSTSNVEVVNIEKDGNSNNLAMQIKTDKENDSINGLVRVLFHHYPLNEKGVFSFSFKVDNFDADKIIRVNGNAVGSNVVYANNKHYYNFIKIKGDDIYFQDNVLIANDITDKTWHRIDYVFDLKTHAGTFWFDGTPTSVSVPDDLINITEFIFDMPTAYDGSESSWYIDDLRLYVADELVDDGIIDEQWQRYKDSTFYQSYEFEFNQASSYDYMAFRVCEGKKYLVVGTNKMFDGSQIAKIPTKIYRKDDKIMMPIRFISESYGAQVGWDDAGQKVTISYDGKTLEVSPGENIYYINGVPTKLFYPVELVDGVACMEIDTMFNFLCKEYFMEKDILWLDKPNEFDWHMPISDGVEGYSRDSSAISNPNIRDDSVYARLLWRILYERPTVEEIDTAFRTYSPNNMHPRIEFTSETLAQLKEGMKTDAQLQAIVNNIIKSADEKIGTDLKYTFTKGEEIQSYLSNTGTNILEVISAAYLLTDDPAKKEEYKAEIWRHFCHLNNLEIFPNWAMDKHSSLGIGEGCYGFATSIDWVDWTDEELSIISDMFKRQLFANVYHVYTCPLWYYEHNFGFGMGNMQLITNGGFMLMAIALYDEDPEFYNDIIRGGLRALEGGFIEYFPNGEYVEGISYWRYAGSRFPRLLKGMQTSMGTDWGLTDVPGVLETANFPFRMRGAITGFSFGDGQPESAIIPLIMFCADQTDNKALAQLRKDNMGQSGDISDVANWVFDTGEYNQGLDIFDTDIMNESNATLILKTGWSRADTAIAIHGGANNDGHGHLDVGNFQLDMSGVRLGIDIIRENYELRDVGYYDKYRVAEFYPQGRMFEGGHYYRIKGEGHNLVVANRQFTNIQEPRINNKPNPESYDMKSTGRGEFVKTEMSDIMSFAWLDVTDTNDVYQSAIRGFKLDKINNIIEIQDDYTAKKPTDFLWSFHTYADIQIAEDGKSAILTQDNQKIKATIINDCDFKFEVLPAAFDETYGTIVKPHIETPNFVYGHDHPFYLTHKRDCDIGSDIRKLAVRTEKGKDVKHFKLAVTFQPYIEGNTPVPEYVPLEQWELKGLKRQYLSSITVDGKPLDVFEPDKYNYSVLVVTEKSDIPEIQAIAADSRVQVETIPATTIPGRANIVLRQDGVTVGCYSVVISPINNTEKFHSDKQLPIFAYSVSAEPEPEAGVANLFDGDFATLFATNEQGGNVIMDLGSVIEGNLKLNISCLYGYKRTEKFKIEYSVDGINYTEAFNGHNSGTTTGLEQFDICNKARYVRVSFYGSSEGPYVSVTELFVSNE